MKALNQKYAIKKRGQHKQKCNDTEVAKIARHAKISKDASNAKIARSANHGRKQSVKRLKISKQLKDCKN